MRAFRIRKLAGEGAPFAAYAVVNRERQRTWDAGKFAGDRRVDRNSSAVRPRLQSVHIG
jgi:hypothetical protein